MELTESSLLQNLTSAKRYSAKDVADFIFLYLITLHILRCEFETAPIAKQYAARTLSAGNWDHIRLSSTDLYQLLNILITKSAAWSSQLKNKAASDVMLADVHLNEARVLKFLRSIQGRFDSRASAQMLLKFEYELKINITNYKSIRRIVGDWQESHVDTEAKSLAVTRLLQALRHRATKGDLNRPLEMLAKQQKLEITNACDPETGKNCTFNTPTTPAKGPSLLKQLAVGAGLGVGAYLLGRALFSKEK